MNLDRRMGGPEGFRSKLKVLFAEPDPLSAEGLTLFGGDLDGVPDLLSGVQRFAEVDLDRHRNPKVLLAVDWDAGVKGWRGGHLEGKGRQGDAIHCFPIEGDGKRLPLGDLFWFAEERKVSTAFITFGLKIKGAFGSHSPDGF